MMSSELLGWVFHAIAILPLVLIVVLTYRWSRRAQSLQRELCLRDIEAAGGFEAWRRMYFKGRK